MAQVTIEGSLTPSTFLARGERRTVVLTDYVRKLIKKGYVIVVKDAPVLIETEPPLETINGSFVNDTPETEEAANASASEGDAEVGDDSGSGTDRGDGADPAEGPESGESPDDGAGQEESTSRRQRKSSRTNS